MKIKEFIRTRNIKMSAQRVEVNENIPYWTNADHWKVHITVPDGQLFTFFSMGYGHKGRCPMLSLVLDALALDCLTAEHYTAFEDFCLEFGYNPDSIKHFNIYKTVHKQKLQLEELLGASDYAVLIYEVERL